LNGDIEAAEKLSDRKPESSTGNQKPGAAERSAQTEADSGHAETQPKNQDRNWKTLRKERDDLERELIAAKAKLEVLSGERAESRPSAPAAQEEARSQDPERPVRPKLKDYDSIEKYEAAMDAYEEAKDAYQDQRLNSREREREAVQSENQIQRTWSDQVSAAQSKYKDFDTVAFSEETPATFVSIPRLQIRADAAEVAYYLGKHPEEALKIAEASDIPSVRTPDQFKAFLKKAQSDPQAAAALARAMAMADFAFDRISENLKKPAVPFRKETRSAPRPTAEVNVDGGAAPIADELAEAIKNNDQEAFNRIQNRRDVERRRNG
jgi:hypothetical protein